jgi:UDP-4-amino-4,6-dideoxy-N-acetyl-beta-L-altrosamine N-acetyltransferase
MTTAGILRAIKEDELPTILAWRNSPKIKANMYSRHDISLEEHLAWWTRLKDSSDRAYFIYEHHGIPTGVVGFSQIDTYHQNASWAFYASPDAPPGSGARMELLALDHAFDDLQLKKLYCEVLEFNQSVINLHTKFGFKVEGVFKEQHLYENSHIDIYRLAILANEWQAKRPEMLMKLKIKEDHHA